MPGTLLRELLTGASHLLYPRLCETCRTPLLHQEQVLCLSCTLGIPQTDFHHIPDNEAAQRIAGRIPYQHASAFAYFSDEGIMQVLLHRLKYSGRKSIGSFLGQKAALALKSSAPWIGTIDSIVPVPLHPRKHSKRGYNQTAIIARAMAEVLGIPVYESALIRTRNTESQTQKSREERIENVRDAFTIARSFPTTARHILLVDDVLTTGATLEAAASALSMQSGTVFSTYTIGLAI